MFSVFPESRLEANGIRAQTFDLIKDQPIPQNSIGIQSRSIGVGTTHESYEELPSCSQHSCKEIDEDTVIRRRSLVPMSSMEEENLRERLHLAQLRLAGEIVNRDQKYTREGFRKLLQSKVSRFGDADIFLDLINKNTQ